MCAFGRLVCPGRRIAEIGHLVADLVNASLEPLHVSVKLPLNTPDAFLDVAQVRLQSSGRSDRSMT